MPLVNISHTCCIDKDKNHYDFSFLIRITTYNWPFMYKVLCLLFNCFISISSISLDPNTAIIIFLLQLTSFSSYLTEDSQFWNLYSPTRSALCFHQDDVYFHACCLLKLLGVKKCFLVLDYLESLSIFSLKIVSK